MSDGECCDCGVIPQVKRFLEGARIDRLRRRSPASAVASNGRCWRAGKKRVESGGKESPIKRSRLMVGHCSCQRLYCSTSLRPIENSMLTGRSNEPRQPNPRPVQFPLRSIFAWITGLAILTALIAGAFGPLLQVVATSSMAIVLGSLAAALVIGGPWIALVWLLRQIVSRVQKRR